MPLEVCPDSSAAECMCCSKKHKEEVQCSKPLDTAVNLIEHEINWVHLSYFDRGTVTCIFYEIWLTVSVYNGSSHLPLQRGRPLFHPPADNTITEVILLRKNLWMMSCVLFSLPQPTGVSIMWMQWEYHQNSCCAVLLYNKLGPPSIHPSLELL